MALAQTTDLERVIQARDFVALHEMLKHWSPSTAASLIEPLPVEQQVVAFRLLPRELAAEVFEYISLEAQQQLVKAMATEEVVKMLNDMAPDDRTALLDELPASVTQQLLNLLSPHERSIAVSLLGYPEGSVGRIMTPDYVRVRPDWTIEHALDHIRRYGQDSETLSIVYVISDDGHLIGEVPIRKILLSSLSGHLADLVHERVVALKATDPQEAAVRLFQTEGRAALPVTDSQGVLIGIVTLDDALNLAESQNTRTLQRFGGVEALDEPYLQTPIVSMIRRRAGWLVVLFLGEMLTATAMGFFEKQIERAVVLALFVPLIISSGGNSGSQAATLVIRALALGEVRLAQWWRVMSREIGSGLALGVILGSIGFGRIAVWSAFSNIYGPHWPLVALTVALALVGIVLWGTLAGSMLPMLLRRLGFDPATSSAPFVATLVDVTGLIIYFSVAILVLRGTLL
ncbi:MAG TPA: magnesium transporter [Gemmatimonadales bacterium]|nr:magnesium transporter [Candidatus Bathyarchaeia archaeon]HUL02142.1 magnesium transporter [Gemmatimonadales bacterium]